MKKWKRIGYIVLLAIVVVLSFTIYTNASKNNGKTQKDKTFSEIKFVETKIANLLNTMNHIESRNYGVVTSELSKETTQKSSGGSSSGSQSGGGSSGGGTSGGQSSGGGSSSGGESSGGGSSSGGEGSGGQSSGEQGAADSSSQGKTEEEEKNKKFELKSKGVLTNTEDINWDSVKSEIENLYTSLPSITIDLYQLNINQEDVLAFNTEIDKLTGVVKDEKKEETLSQLTKVYEYIPKFLRSSGQEELYTTLIETKLNVFKAYAKLDTDNWQEISKDMKNAIDSYSKLLTNTEIEARKQYNISKAYIMLNELQNAVNLQDTSVFLIKYKNLLEEMNNI